MTSWKIFFDVSFPFPWVFQGVQHCGWSIRWGQCSVRRVPFKGSDQNAILGLAEGQRSEALLVNGSGDWPIRLIWGHHAHKISSTTGWECSFAWAQGLQFANFHIQPSNSVGRSSILSVLSFFLEGPTAFTICRKRTHQPKPADPPVVQRPLDRDRSSAPDWDLDTWWDIFVDFKPIRISIVKGLSGSSVALLLYWYYPMLIHHNISRLGVSRSSFG